MLAPALLASSGLIDISSAEQQEEYAIQYFIEDLRYLFSKQGPFSDEFLPYLEGGIDMIGFFAAQADKAIYQKFLKLKKDFTHFHTDPALIDVLAKDCKQLFSFPKLRFVERINAFEEAINYLEHYVGTNLSPIAYANRAYIYGAAKALNEIHEELCDYICIVYDNRNWEEYFNFEDLEQYAHDFLLNPTRHQQLQLQVVISLLKAKIHNL